MRLHLVDGTFELFRAHYSKRPRHKSRDGTPIKATAGLISSMLGLLSSEEEKATHVAIAFDNPIESFRNELFDGYKTGLGIEPELRAQFDLAETAAAALGLTVWSMDRYEADDALATGAVKFKDRVEQVRILTPDKDLGQVLVGDRVVQVDQIRRRILDEAHLMKTKAIRPESIPDYLALVGDSADGIPGIAGFGAKTAGVLLGQFVHIEDIPRSADTWPKVRGAAKLAETLASAREEVLLYRTLATLIRDVPLSESLEQIEHRGVPRGRFEALCETLALDVADRVPRWAD